MEKSLLLLSLPGSFSALGALSKDSPTKGVKQRKNMQERTTSILNSQHCRKAGTQEILPVSTIPA